MLLTILAFFPSGFWFSLKKIMSNKAQASVCKLSFNVVLSGIVIVLRKKKS